MNEKKDLKNKIFVLSIVTCIIIAVVVIGVISSSFVSKGTYSAAVSDDNGGGGAGGGGSYVRTKVVKFYNLSLLYATVNCTLHYDYNKNTGKYSEPYITCPSPYNTTKNWIKAPENPTLSEHKFIGWSTNYSQTECINEDLKVRFLPLNNKSTSVEKYYACYEFLKEDYCSRSFSSLVPSETADELKKVKIILNTKSCACDDSAEISANFTKDGNICYLKDSYINEIGTLEYSYKHSLLPSGFGCSPGYTHYSTLCVHCQGGKKYNTSTGKCESNAGCSVGYSKGNVPDGATVQISEPGPISVSNCDSYTLENGPEISDSRYTFAGWSDGSTTYSAGQFVKLKSGLTTFTAQWKKTGCYVNINANGGTNKCDSKYIYEGTVSKSTLDACVSNNNQCVLKWKVVGPSTSSNYGKEYEYNVDQSDCGETIQAIWGSCSSGNGNGGGGTYNPTPDPTPSSSAPSSSSADKPSASDESVDTADVPFSTPIDGDRCYKGTYIHIISCQPASVENAKCKSSIGEVLMSKLTLTAGCEKSSQPTTSSEKPNNPQTGVGSTIFIWVIGIGTLLFSIFYFKKNYLT